MKNKSYLIVLILLLIVAFYSCSTNTKLEGTYKYTSCGEALDCNYFEFFENGTYRYNVILNTTQQKSFNGSWSLKNDTIILNPYPYIFPDSTKLELLNNIGDSKTNISINMLVGYEKGQKPDTLKVRWFVSLDNGANYVSTNDSGTLTINKHYIHKIKIRDIMQQSSNFKLFANKDSIFDVNAEVNNINIYMALTDRHPDELEFMPRKLFWKGNTLYPVDFDTNLIRLVSTRNYYKLSIDKTNK